MGGFFTLAQRQLQGEFEPTDLADRITEPECKTCVYT